MVDIAPPKGRIITPLADVYDGPAIRLSSLVVNRPENSDFNMTNLIPRRRVSEVERLGRLSNKLRNALNCHRLSKNLTPLQKQMKKQFFSKKKEILSPNKNRPIHNSDKNTNNISSIYREKFNTASSEHCKAIARNEIMNPTLQVLGQPAFQSWVMTERTKSRRKRK